MLTASTALTRAGVWLIAQVPAVGDTLIMKQAPIDPGWFERTAQILDAVLTIAFIALAAAVIPAAWNFRQSYKKISELLDRVYADVNPIAHHASRIAENVDFVSTAIRADVQRASALVTDAERRLQRAVARAEVRAKELEALIEVAQEEAEDTFVTAASTVRGVRASMVSLGDALGEAIVPPRPPRRPPIADEPLLATGDALDELALVEARPGRAAHAARMVRPIRPDLLDEDPLGVDALDDLPYDDDDFEEDGIDAEDDARADARERPRVRPRRGPGTRG
ncbi:MAG: hypothetical protein ACXW05_12785 [Gemmatirosa sp.]